MSKSTLIYKIPEFFKLLKNRIKTLVPKKYIKGKVKWYYNKRHHALLNIKDSYHENLNWYYSIKGKIVPKKFILILNSENMKTQLKALEKDID